MSDEIWPAVHAERKALADDLRDLAGEQWATPTACPAWNVHGVLAHLLSATTMTPPKFFGKFVAAGFDFDRYVGREVERECAGGPAATLAAFRAAADRTSAPTGAQADLARRGAGALRGHPAGVGNVTRLPARPGGPHDRLLYPQPGGDRRPRPGRRAALDELTGPGVEMLRRR